ncbi:cysteinyl-tRNA synthetase [Candidatus Phycorickettsia trachydisci]|uniref:Cysteine--tRNA ligase n=1 Tax=Candidatus Phycorickettsia trachydisci TaxID=2115978 RepID=A0A2P1P816_9RICK|nr:cysteine--tRNA ligase [Candidatus Phycorickettsia trachydisci]AVP87420.1 cysteinyl-tRNA synthetase [Candidatus Phycorickettsia trachydisci]
MKLYLQNTLSKKKELFEPLNNKAVGMYVCGPTVYDFIHIGNARSLVVYDTLYRLLSYIYGKDHVIYVRNITDVDDKINNRAKQLGIPIFDLTKKTIADFYEDASYLNCLSPNIEPKATDHMPQMIEMIQRLLDNGCAYVKEGNVYFDAKSYKDYTKLSGRKIAEAKSGTRVVAADDKIHLEDWVLWKIGKHGEYESPFESPWGRGYPGWHIECSAMSYQYLGSDFDIHGGGIDLIFPHHTNEIAQSCCALPGSRFAQFWVHNGFLNVEGEKMSKSLNNFITVQDVRNQGIEGDVLRYALLNAHYHKPLNFSKQLLNEATKNISLLRRVTQDVRPEKSQEADDFFAALFDDLNTRKALQYLVSLAKKSDLKLSSCIKYCANFIGLLEKNVKLEISTKEIEQLIQTRLQAKKDKNWALVDRIRNDLREKGIILQDLKDGTTSWYKE